MPRRLAQTSASATACASAAGTPRAAKMPATTARRSSAASLTFAGRAAAVSVDTGSVGKAPPPDSLGNRARLLVGELLRGGLAYLVSRTLTTALWPPRTA